MKTEYSGTQTEQNLRAAFSVECEARNKYTFFASVAKKEGFEQISALFRKPPKTSRRTRSSGSRRCAASARLPKTSSTPQTASNTNGASCTTSSPKPPNARASPRLPRSFVRSRRSKSTTRRAFARCCTMSKRRRYSKNAGSSHGNAAIAAISSSVRVRRPSVRPASIRRASSSSAQKTTKSKNQPAASIRGGLIFLFYCSSSSAVSEASAIACPRMHATNCAPVIDSCASRYSATACTLSALSDKMLLHCA